ncbi:MarR family transcriptional regulator [Micromonospora sp. NPDC049559]|uniref:MarR family transcriptional regulator n=1 Tax=Micromonospora sp. NPDC049559 TaxID=3155923 RepID=UPI00342E5738
MSEPASPDERRDLLDSHRWRPLRLLLESMDADIVALYADAGVTGLRARFVGPLIQLGRRESMTIQELATAIEVTHSAMSQTVAAMRTAGFVESVADAADARARRIRLSARGREVLPLLEAEWRATEATVREIEAEIPYPLSRVVEEISVVLARRPFRQRLDDNIARALRGELE